MIVAVAGILLGLSALSAHAASTNTRFSVSVQVLHKCHVNLPEASSPAGQLALSCSRGTGYQVLFDGHPAAAGAGKGVTQLLSLPMAAGVSPSGAAEPPPHWLTILY